MSEDGASPLAGSFLGLSTSMMSNSNSVNRSSNSSHALRLAHAYGVYPSGHKDSIISLGDDGFLFCVGRQLAIYDYVSQRVRFLERECKGRIITALTKSANSHLLAVAERVGADGHGLDGTAQICVMTLPGWVDSKDSGSTLAKSEVLKTLIPQNKRLDIVGVAFASSDGKFLVSLSSMPDCTITYWRWEVEKAMATYDCKLATPLGRLLVNPQNGYQISVSGPQYMKIWEYNPNDRQLRELPSMLPGLQQEKQSDFTDHCWVLGMFLCACTSDGHVHLFSDLEHKRDVDVREIVAADEVATDRMKEKEQARVLASMGKKVTNVGKVQLRALAPWSRGFVVGGDRGYLGVFKVDANLLVEPFGTFRMPEEDSVIWHMSASTEDTHLTILSYKEKQDSEGDSVHKVRKPASGSRGVVVADEPGQAMKQRMWSLSTFPVGQADLAATGQLEVFAPVFKLGTHHGPVLSMSIGGSRRLVATCGVDNTMKVWGYPTDYPPDRINSFSSQLSIKVSGYDKTRALSVHPLGFQAAVILEDSVRIYHLTNPQSTRTFYELPLKKPGHVAYSNSGSLLAVTSDNDVVLMDPWRATVIHIFSGRGGHLSPVTQVLFSEDDRMLLSSARAPHGAIYGWDLESDTKERTFEHISKHTSYSCIAYDFRRKLVAGVQRADGNLRVLGHLSAPHVDIVSEGRGHHYTTLHLSAHLNLLFAGTEQGSIRLFKWPLTEGGNSKNPFAEFNIHAHSVSCISLTQDAKYLYSACDGGSVFAAYVESLVEETPTRQQLMQKYVRYRFRADGGDVPNVNNKSLKDDQRKIQEIEKKFAEIGQGMSASQATLDELVLVPKLYFNERLSEIRELEERMQRLRHESEYALEQKEHEVQEKLKGVRHERNTERQGAEEKYDNLFTQLKKSNERHQELLNSANSQFDRRTQEMQREFELSLSKEYEKQSVLLTELQNLRDQQAREANAIEEKHDAQVRELRGMQEKAMREWRAEYDKVCNLLKSDGLKFEEAMRQQEIEYEAQITEFREHKRVALQVESEKSTTALKDGVSMRQTISILHRQLEAKDQELARSRGELQETKKKLEVSLEMFAKQELKLKERERGLQVKDESLAKLREQMKHLESFRFVLFHKVKELEEERDPLEQQVSFLKTSVRDMYGEFVREFRDKRTLDQQLSDKKTMVTSMQKDINHLMGNLVQLKKDARRLFQEVESVLYADTAEEFHQIPKRLREVVEKHKKLSQWSPPSEEETSAKTDQEAHQEVALLQEMVVQRDLLFRKNQIAMGQAAHAKQNCMQDFRRLTSENAQLINEMNMLRNEKKSMDRANKQLEATIMKLREKEVKDNSRLRCGEDGPRMEKSTSAPSLGGVATGGDFGGGGVGAYPGHSGKGPKKSDTANTPYIRRKVVEQQELYRKRNRLPPVLDGNNTTKTMAPHQRIVEGDPARRVYEAQGFDVNRLTQQVAAMTSAYFSGEDADGGALPASTGFAATSPPAVTISSVSSGGAVEILGAP